MKAYSGVTIPHITNKSLKTDSNGTIIGVSNVKAGVSVGVDNGALVINHGLGTTPSLVMIEGGSFFNSTSGVYDGTNNSCTYYAGVDTTAVYHDDSPCGAYISSMNETSFTMVWQSGGQHAKFRWIVFP